MRRYSWLLILLAGCFWGIMGVFVHTFTAMGFTTMQIAAMRLMVSAIVMGVVIGLFCPRLFRVSLRDLPLLSILGIVSIGMMGYLYFTTIRLSMMSAAAVLLYLSPVVVMLLSALIFKERITTIKVISLALAVGGCSLVSGIVSGGSIGWLAILTGLGSAVTYGSYSIIGPFALKKYHPFTVTVYAFAAAAIVLLALCDPIDLAQRMTAVNNSGIFCAQVLGLGLCTAVIPFVLYTLGLKYTSPSKASVLACSEPVAAILFGMLVYGEYPDIFGWIGMAMVLFAIFLISHTNQQNKRSDTR